ncbi:hypothetical protein L7F22_059494 [Adiantum nelumboides]|nr:hypothetical protein [Adiantum nelumboides]
MRWANFLSRFNFHIAHIAGKHNQVADALSRRPKVNAVSIATHNDLSSMIDEYALDPDFKDVISAIALGKKEEPLTLQDGYLLHGNRLCITRSLREKVMFESHAPPYAGHRGIQTTMKAIETYFYWPTMKGDIQDYVSKCVVCQKTKYDRGKQPGLLQPLPIPDSPWESISMDFIFGLPKSIHGNTGIWTIVNRFSKQAHFIPVKKTIKEHQMATLFISQVFKYHGLPTSIVSDRDPRMTSNFWKGLFENLGGHGSTQGSNVVKHNLEEKPIQIPRRPDLSRGHLEANKEKPIQMLRPLLSLLNLEDKEGKKEEGQSSLQLESKEDAGDSYDEDECKSNTIVWEATSIKPTTKTIVQELTSVELGTNNTTVWEDTSVELTTKTTVQELTFVELGTSNTIVWEATSVEPTTKTTLQEHEEATSVEPTTKTTLQEHEVTAAATSVGVTVELEHKATTVKEHTATSSSSIAEEHNVATVEAANVGKLEEAILDIDGDNLKLSSFIPAGFKMRKSHSRPTHNGYDLVHLPKTRVMVKRWFQKAPSNISYDLQLHRVGKHMVSLKPGLIELGPRYDVGCWSSMTQKNMMPIVNLIKNEVAAVDSNIKFKFHFSQEECVHKEGIYHFQRPQELLFLKLFTVLLQRGIQMDPTHTLLIDDNLDK